MICAVLVARARGALIGIVVHCITQPFGISLGDVLAAGLEAALYCGSRTSVDKYSRAAIAIRHHRSRCSAVIVNVVVQHRHLDLFFRVV